MVRIIGLIFVFGIASLCVASFFRATTAKARSDHAVCPCWPGGLAATTLGNPTTTNITFDTCDTKHRYAYIVEPALLDTLDAEASSLADEIGADAFIIWHVGPSSPGGGSVELTGCDLFTAPNPMDGIPESEAQACIHDILAYCRDYCMYNPNAPCQ